MKKKWKPVLPTEIKDINIIREVIAQIRKPIPPEVYTRLEERDKKLEGLIKTTNMYAEQTVEIPPNRRLTIDVPPEVPEGRVILTFKPAPKPPETMLLSEAALAADWNTPEEDEAWADV